MASAGLSGAGARRHDATLLVALTWWSLAATCLGSGDGSGDVFVCPIDPATQAQVIPLCDAAGFDCAGDAWTEHLGNEQYVSELQRTSVNEVAGLAFDHISGPFIVTAILLVISLLRLCKHVFLCCDAELCPPVLSCGGDARVVYPHSIDA